MGEYTDYNWNYARKSYVRAHPETCQKRDWSYSCLAYCKWLLKFSL